MNNPPMARQRHRYSRRRVAFWNRASGSLLSDHGDGCLMSPDLPLSHVLNLIAHVKPALRPRVLFVMGGDTAATRPRASWWAEPTAAGWQYDGYELRIGDGERDGTRNAGTYTRLDPAGGDITIDVRCAAVWFDAESDPYIARDAWNMLNDWLAGVVRDDPYATLLTTPPATGADLFLRWLPTGRPALGDRGGRGVPIQYDPIPADIADILRHNVGQGRLEFCPDPSRPAGEMLDGLYWLDAVWMYASCCTWLPVGPVQHQTYPDPESATYDEVFPRYVPGFYRVNAWIPDMWRHVGLIPVRGAGADVSEWPATPGGRIDDAWLSSAELDVAVRAGWHVSVCERIIWPEYQTAPGANPARAWIDRLRDLRRRADALAADGDRTGALAARAIRHMQIGTVGKWGASEKHRLIEIATGATPPAGARWHHTDRKRGMTVYYQPIPLSKADAMLARPEFAATVWGRSRAKVNGAALTIKRRHIIAFRSDAIVLDGPFGLTQSSTPGEFRIKDSDSVPGPLPLPATAEAMLSARRLARGA